MKTTTHRFLALALGLAAAACGSSDHSSNASPTEGAAPSQSPTAAASPVEACKGEYDPDPGNVPQWLHRTPQGCMLGAGQLLNTDGTVVVGPAFGAPAETGRWNGDEYYFWISYQDGSVTQYSRKAAEPSK
jgi:hypothetical protein